MSSPAHPLPGRPIDAPALPRVVGGRFEVGRRLGVGGEAEVYRARDLELDLDVVLKTRLIVDGADLSRLRREAATLMRTVAHPGIPTVRSDLVDSDRYFMISDFVDGHDLHALVAAHEHGGVPLPTVLALIDQVADTLDHLHQHTPPVVHGDVKPENVLLTPDGRAVLIDFGTAMRVGDEQRRFGTPGFSAPEVLAGEDLSPAADVYSLAALAVFLLTGIVPTLGTPWISELGDTGLARLERVIRRGLTWNPLGRPATATDFARHLRDAAEMDLPTGTITLLLVHDDRSLPTTLTALEDAGGRHAAAASLPDDHALAVFTRAADAVVAALAVNEATGAPVALHAGDVGGWHGATLQQLAEQCREILEPGATPERGVVCSTPVRMLVGADETLEFESLSDTRVGIRRATGTSVAAPTSESSIDHGVERAASWITTRVARPLVGRVAELDAAAGAVERARAADQAPLLFVVGDAGMGKTRFLAELANRATTAGDVVLVGRCTEMGGAFEPFLDALGDDFFAFDSGQLERDEEGWVDRRRFFGRIARALRALNHRVTLVIDDMQWIDGSSLALLTQLLDDVGPALTVAAGTRPVPETNGLDELTLRPASATLSIGPLTTADITAMAHERGLELDRDTIEGLHALTGGSPFFGLQLLGHLGDARTDHLDADHLPAGVREWVLQRVDRLGSDARDTLAPAAVVGRDFEVVVLADVLGVSPLDALTHLDAAARTGLLVDGDHPGAFRFVHAIVRTTLEESLSPSHRALLHAAIARRWEEEGDDLPRREAAMHHWLAADRLGDPLHAGDIAAEVATQATERLAHERAVSVLLRALEVLGGAPASTQRDGVEARLRVALGRAEFVATRNAEAVEQLYRAADLAESGGDPATLAEAALVASLNRRHGRDDPELLRLLERASATCPPEPAVLPAMLHVRRSRLLPLTVRHEERSAMARRALVDLDLMDAVDRATVETEVARACWCPDDADERIAVTTRLVDVADRELRVGGPSRWTGVLIEALNLRWAARVQVGNVLGALDDADRAAAVADEAGTSFLLSRVMMGQAMIHATLGNHELAERLSRDALELSDRHNLVLVQMAIAYSIGRDRGQQQQLSELEQQLGDLVDSNPMFVAAFALVHAESGQHDDARRLLSALTEHAPWPRNWLWLATTTAALETAILVGDRQLTERLTAVLTRYSGSWAMAAAELACWGPVDRVLGLAHAAAGRVEQGRALMTAALESARSQHAGPWIERCTAGLEAATVAQVRSS